MTDEGLVAKKLAFVETCVRELRTLARLDALADDVRERRFVELATRLRRAIGLRNVLVHGYTEVDLAVVRDVVEHRLDDLLAFTAAVRARLGPIVEP